MKRFIHNFTLIVTLLLIRVPTQATGFETINGLKYLIDTEKNEASLVANDSVYSGDFVVPEKINSDGQEYPVTSFGNNCFYDCSALTSINIPPSVTSLGNCCFYNCKGLTSITIPSSVTSLGDYCFFNCSALISINIPSSITSLGVECFENCSGLTSINIPSSITSLNFGCFFRCSGLKSITIPSSVKSLGVSCFWGCSELTSITIPSSVTSLGDECFTFCSGLTSITLPSSLKNLGVSCFSGCIKLTSIRCYAITPPECYQYSFSGFNPSLCKLYVPKESIDKYKAADGWKDFPNIYVIKESDESDHISNTSTSGIIATSNNRIITIFGLKALKNVTFYSVDGNELGSAVAVDGTATYAVNTTGDIVIAKFGGSSIKIVTK